MIAKRLTKKGTMIAVEESVDNGEQQLPSFLAAMMAPLTAIVLLALRPLAGIVIDPIIALPAGGPRWRLVHGPHQAHQSICDIGPRQNDGRGGYAARHGNIGRHYIELAVEKCHHRQSGLFRPAGLLAGPDKRRVHVMATASTTAGTAVASSVFGSTIMELGVASLGAAAMIHAGATVFDHMPHGSFFHATGGSVNMAMKERLRLIPYETLIGLVLAIVSTLVFGVFGWFL